METVEVVIRIPKSRLEELHKIWNSLFATTLLNDDEIAILSGTVLPKGHGRLGDLDAYLKDTPIRNVDDTWIKESYVYESIINAPTVIEADKAESENKE